MYYSSTRNNKIKVNSAFAITKGISDEGGLFIPEQFPKLNLEQIGNFGELSYEDRAYEIFKLFLTDFTDDEIQNCVNNAYNDNNFASDSITEISHLIPDVYVLELWHGPTCAFKDMALQALPHLLTTSAKKTINGKKIAILVATSGDTGKAALEGFKNIDGTSITVFYPEDGVSQMQKRQMTTQEGSNVNVCAVKGNFDDCQTGVKKIFTDKEIIKTLDSKNIMLSSANSINWGRLAPQIIYYISTYAELVQNNEIELGEEINVVVPTGNFGNILAAYYAKEMGIPIKKLICASNSNNILTDFINTGVYDRNRGFITTISPSMDILISSNLERLLYHLSGNDDKLINKWFDDLSSSGKYEVNQAVKDKITNLFYGGFCDDNDTKKVINSIFNEYSYLMDTHTAVAFKVYEDYKKNTGDSAKTIIVSTASPYKFGLSVYNALGGENNENEFEIIKKISEKTNTIIPKALADTENKKIIFKDSIDKEDMSAYVLNLLNN